jgi:hypothetical protein
VAGLQSGETQVRPTWRPDPGPAHLRLTNTTAPPPPAAWVA